MIIYSEKATKFCEILPIFWRLKDNSTPDFSTPCFNPRLSNYELSNPGLFNHELSNPGLFNPRFFNHELFNTRLLNPGFFNPMSRVEKSWGSIEGDQMSGDWMCSGPNEMQPLLSSKYLSDKGSNLYLSPLKIGRCFSQAWYFFWQTMDFGLLHTVNLLDQLALTLLSAVADRSARFAARHSFGVHRAVLQVYQLAIIATSIVSVAYLHWHNLRWCLHFPHCHHQNHYFRYY